MDVKKTLTAAAEIRKLTIKALAQVGQGHIGGSMSQAELLAVLYTDILENIDPKNITKKNRDQVVLSKGHCGPGLYAALCYKGYFDEQTLLSLNTNGTKLPSHCDRLKTPGIDISTGSLGQGLSLAAGVAMGNKMQHINARVYCIIGDGELQEGQNWEALQFIAHRQLDNLITIIDNNRRQLDDYTEAICKQFDLNAKLKSFGFNVLEGNGHDVGEIFDLLKQAKDTKSRATAVILNTEKGQGANFAEIKGFNHYMTINRDMERSALQEIDTRLEREVSAL